MRSDFKVISDIVESGTRVLDIGCGNGSLMRVLKEKKNITVRGIEIDQSNVSKAMAAGLAVIQGDADADLEFYPDKSFDYAILTQTLQATQNPKEVLRQMVRIGKHAIVSFPNFGYWKNRLYLALNGRMPVTESLSYEWHETPNIHFCTIRDFVILTRELNLKIEKSLGLNGRVIDFHGISQLANLFASQGLFVLYEK